MSTLVPGDIRKEWDSIRPHIEDILAEGGYELRPEDVYAACSTGTAFLYLGEPGFVIVQPKTYTFHGDPELVIWFAYSRDHGAIEEFQSAIDALAVGNKFRRLIFWSNRPGFERVPGWRKISSVYERVLP